MSIKLKIKRIDHETVGATVHGDCVSEAKPDAGEAVIRIVDKAEVTFFKVGKTYLCVEETGQMS